MKVAAIGDIHAPLFLDIFRRSLDKFLKFEDEVSLFLIAGDIIEGKRLDQLKDVKILLDKIKVPIYACFGNNEYQDNISLIKESLPNVHFLDDEYVELSLNNKRIYLVGSRGVLDQPTYWQRKNWPGIADVYRERTLKLKQIAESGESDYKVLLIHYPPTYGIIEGENTKFLSSIGSKKLETLVEMFDLVVTAHAHKGKRYAEVKRVCVYNVSLPLTGEITIIDLDRKRGLDRFFLF
ncbi:MAG: metallophosphoesterase [Nitrososphaeria archaeon]